MALKTFKCADTESLFGLRRVARFANIERPALRRVEAARGEGGGGEGRGGRAGHQPQGRIEPYQRQSSAHLDRRNAEPGFGFAGIGGTVRAGRRYGAASSRHRNEDPMRSILLLALGVPIPVIILLAIFFHH